MTAVYPSPASERTRWIVDRRGPRNHVHSNRPYAFFLEQERTASGRIADVVTIFLTNRECPWRCVMCDLWRNTTEERVASGEIPGQIEFALSELGAATVLKLYNSGSFFDRAAIPPTDWRRIAGLSHRFEHVIVESHPRLIDVNVSRFRAMLDCSLEVAVGLETAHPGALDAINKRITLEDYRRAAADLLRQRVALRTFLLVNPPFIDQPQQWEWLKRSIEVAFDAGSSVVSLIPLRAGNGAIDELVRRGLASEPTIARLEAAQEWGIAQGRGRVFADTWDLQRFSRCAACSGLRRDRIKRMNLSQRIETRITCCVCGSA